MDTTELTPPSSDSDYAALADRAIGAGGDSDEIKAWLASQKPVAPPDDMDTPVAQANAAIAAGADQDEIDAWLKSQATGVQEPPPAPKPSPLGKSKPAPEAAKPSLLDRIGGAANDVSDKISSRVADLFEKPEQNDDADKVRADMFKKLAQKDDGNDPHAGLEAAQEVAQKTGSTPEQVLKAVEGPQRDYRNLNPEGPSGAATAFMESAASQPVKLLGSAAWLAANGAPQFIPGAENASNKLNEVSESMLSGNITPDDASVMQAHPFSAGLGQLEGAIAIAAMTPEAKVADLGKGATFVRAVLNNAGRHLPGAVAAGGVPQAVEAAKRTVDTGGSLPQAYGEAATAGALGTAQFDAPMSMGGGLVTRALTGEATMQGLSRAQTALQHTIDPKAFEENRFDPRNPQEYMGALMGLLGEREGPAHQVTVAVYNDLNETAYDPKVDPPTRRAAKKTVELANQLSNVDGLSSLAIDAAGVGAQLHEQILATPHKELLKQTRYSEIYRSAIDSGMTEDAAQTYAVNSFANEQGTNAAWDHYLSINHAAKDVVNNGNLMAQTQNLYAEAKQVVSPEEMAKLLKWARKGQRSILELNQALQETTAAKAVPDYINEGEQDAQDTRGQPPHPAGPASGNQPDRAAAPVGQPGATTVTQPQIAAQADHANSTEGLGQGHPPVAADAQTGQPHQPDQSGQAAGPVANNGGADNTPRPDQSDSGRTVPETGTAGFLDQSDQGRATEPDRAASQAAAVPEHGEADRGEPDRGSTQAAAGEPDRGSTQATTPPEHGESDTSQPVAGGASASEQSTASPQHDGEPAGRRRKSPFGKSGAAPAASATAETASPQHDGEPAGGRGDVATAESGLGGDGQVVEDDTPDPPLEIRYGKRRPGMGMGGLRSANVTQQLGESVPVHSDGKVVLSPDTPEDVANHALDVAANDTAASSTEFEEPTEAQIKHGNYRKGGILFKSAKGDLPVRIENPDGSVRRGEWGTRPIKGAHYGYVPGTTAADGAPVDVLVTRHAHDDSRPIAFINQRNLKTGAHDEVKMVLGAASKRDAYNTYLRQYPGHLHGQLTPNGIKDVVMMPREKAIRYLRSGGTDVPPHPISGQPMLKLRDSTRYEAKVRDVPMDEGRDKLLDDLNAKHGTSLEYRAGGIIMGDVPVAKAGAIDKAVRTIDGFQESNYDPGRAARIKSREKAAAKPAAKQRNAGTRLHAGEVPREAPPPKGTHRVESDAPLFQEGQGKHPVSVLGVHYSGVSGLTELDPRKAGTGSAGGERRRFGMGNFGNSGDPLARMTHFYVQEGKSLPGKEAVVAGNNIYQTRLNNLYDVRTDPDNIIEDAYQSGYGMNKDRIMEEIHDAGYDGVFMDSLPGMSAKHMATIFGIEGKIPTKEVREKDESLLKKFLEKTSEAYKAEEETRGRLRGAKMMFMGEKSPKADLSGLERAKAFHGEKQPKPVKQLGKVIKRSQLDIQIRKDTGWFRGRDGKWRYEISDKPAKLKPYEHGAVDPQSWTNRALVNMDTIRSNLEFDKARAKAPTLDEVLDHPELFEHAPYLKNVKVMIDTSMPDEALGATQDNGKTLFIHHPEFYEGRSADEQVLPVILHESMHAIQRHEGFATGGSWQPFFRKLSDLHENYEAEVTRLRRKLDDLNTGETPTGPYTKESLAADIKKLHQDAIEGHYFDVNDAAQYAYKQYQNLAGEVEARNVEKRYQLSLAEALPGHPFETEDAAGGDKQLVDFEAKFSGKETNPNQTTALFEVAPDPHNTELTEKFAALPPERRAEITHQFNDTITPQIMDALGLKVDHYVSSYGGYMDQVNPSLGAVFKEGTKIEDVKRAAAAAGHVFNQDSVIVTGKGAGDAVGRVHIELPEGYDYNDTSRLYAHLRQELGEKVGGFTGTKDGIDILNFDKNLDTEQFKNEIKDAMEKHPEDRVAGISYDTTEADFIGKDQYESHRQGLPEAARQTLDGIRGSATQALREAIEGKPARDEAHHEEVVGHAADITARLKHVPETHVVHDRADAPEEVKAALDAMLPEGEVPQAIYLPETGKVTVFSSAVGGRAEVEQALFHELNGHFGLKGTFGDELPKLLDAIHPSIKGTAHFQNLMRRYEKSYGDRGAKQLQRDVTEEYLATMAERPMERSTWNTLVGWVRDWGRRMGLVSKWTDNDLKGLMARVANDVAAGRISAHGMESPQTTFDEQEGTATSSYDGAAGKGSVVHYEDGTRDVSFPRVKATIGTTVHDGRVLPSVSKVEIESPEGLHDLGKFLAEEGRSSFALDRSVDRGALDSSKLGYTRRLGFYEVQTPRVKSQAMFALRNRVEFDPDTEEAIDKAIDYTPLHMTPWDRMQRTMRYVRDHVLSGEGATRRKAAWIDAAAFIDKMERKLNGGSLLDAAQSAYKMYWLSRNTEQIVAGTLRLGVPEYKNGEFLPVKGRQGYLDILRPLFDTPDGKMLDRAFEAYATGVRADRLLQEFNPDGTPKEQNLDEEDVGKLLAIGDKYPVVKQVLAKQQEFTNQLLDLAVDRGVMDEETAKRWQENIYVPFYRSFEDEPAKPHIGEGRASDKVTSRELKGYEGAIQPVLENIVKNTSAILDRIYSNEARRRVVALGSLSGAVERMKMPLQKTWISAEEAIRMLKRAGIVVDKSNLTDEDLNALTSIVRPVRPLAHDVVSTMEKGKVVYWRVRDPDVLKAIDFMHKVDTTGVVARALMGIPKHLYTIGVTLDPRFMFKIALRDAMTAWVQTGTNPNMLKNVFKNTKDILTDGDFINQLRLNGFSGNEYYQQHEMRQFMQKVHGNDRITVLNSPKRIYQAYRRVGWVSEQLSRMNVARHTIKNGGSYAEAAWQGQNSMNWQKHGSGDIAQFLMRTVPFLNAHVQGVVRLYDGALGHDVTQNPKRAMISFAMKAASLTAASLALNARNQDDPRYKRIPEQAKDLYWHWFVGGYHFMLPKPFEIGAVAATLPEHAMRYMMGKESRQEAEHGVYDVLSEILGGAPVPQLVKPPIEVWANRDFDSGHPIVTQREQNLLPEDQYDDKTSMAARKLGGALGSSPAKIDYMTQAYLGTAGTYLLQVADAATRGVTGGPSKPASRFPNRLVGAVLGTISQGPAATDPRNKYVNMVYDEQAVADQVVATFNDYRKRGDIEGEESLVEKYGVYLNDKGVAHVPNDQAIQKLSTMLGKIRKKESVIYNSDATPAEKRKQLDDLNQSRIEILDSVSELLESNSKNLSVLDQ